MPRFPASAAPERLLDLLRQVGPLGATPSELSAWAGINENQICTHLRALRRCKMARKTKATRLSPSGGAQAVWLAYEEAS